ncbi:hypothetical protein [Pseudonocardia acaciae]|uniref:sunset domain-containing protein n=1 Tax=Pseudonocardia acaciae TaxID=551276 RepID=UPI00048EDA8E|nr:hypothetical protein [Pseudonocardia acaciae]
MAELLQHGPVLPLVLAVIVVLVAIVVIGVRMRAVRRRRARAEREAEANVIETPPDSDPGPPDPNDQVRPADANPAEPAAREAGPPEPEPRPPAPVAGVDSALAALDVGRFTSSLSPGSGARRRPLMPVPRAAADDTAADPAADDPEPADNPEPADERATEPPYPGAAHPRPDGSAPSSEYRIKANLAVKRYYTDASPYYARTTAQLWFRTAEDAERAGFTAAR